MRVTVEYVPRGVESRRRVLGTVKLSNKSQLAEVSNYLIEFEDDEGTRRAARVEKHRRSKGWLDLVTRAFEVLSGD